jgi:hypothetical protein
VKNNLRNVALLLIGCLLSSCASITRGPNEVIVVESHPTGANATISCAGNVSAQSATPARFTIPRKADGCHVSIEKSGMKKQEIALERGINGSYWLNFIPTVGFPIGGLISSLGDSNNNAPGWFALGLVGAAGFVVDHFTGAMYDHNPGVINVTLQPEQ